MSNNLNLSTKTKTNKMVRKRSRASRKYYESDENDSDSDFSLDDTPAQPAVKKYSLRQRKRPLFTEDFDYDEDGEEIEPPKQASDDEDFEVEKELALEEDANLDVNYELKTTYVEHYEQDAEELPEDADGLIDFEDMIRADIVVNKNRIDYDNIIQKTEIKVQPIPDPQPVIKSKRGRKPKIRPVEQTESSILEPETEVNEEAENDDKNDKDYNPEDDICHEELHLQETIKENDNLPNNEENAVESTKEKTDTAISQQTEDVQKTDVIPEESNIPQDSMIKVNDNSSEDIHVNGKVSPNCVKESEENIIDITRQENDDDDVVLIEEEKKCEVIVLDD